MKSCKNFRLYIVSLCYILCSCNKLVEVDVPVTYVTGKSVYDSRETAIAYIAGIYTKMVEAQLTSGTISALSLLPALSADELSVPTALANPVLQAYYKNQLNAAIGSTNNHCWSILYNYIFMANSAIEGLKASTGLEKSIKDQLLGEVLFLRAFYYFYLVNLYGDVPLQLTADYLKNSVAPRVAVELVYQQIIDDLSSAKKLLSDRYLESDLMSSSSGTLRVRPMRYAASALLSRVYLYTGKYALAEQEALSVIKAVSLYSLASLDNAFKADNSQNKESILQFQPVVAGRYTQDAWLFILPASGPTIANSNNPVYVNNSLVNSFEADDLRKQKWMNFVTVQGQAYYYPFKYQNKTGSGLAEHTIVLRLAEQYMIGAEARARQGNISGADTLLNEIRKRAGLQPLTSSGTDDAIAAILHEKQVELFTEFGHRWLDLKRVGQIDQRMQVITPQKSGESWRSYQQWYPILLNDIQINPGLAGHQNEGY